MFVNGTTSRRRDRVRTNYLLVESRSTPEGPRHQVVCSLGSLEPAPREHWLALAHRAEKALAGQMGLEPDPEVEAMVEKIRRRKGHIRPGRDDDLAIVRTRGVQAEQAREAGPVHVGHHMWRQLGLDELLAEVGLSRKAVKLTKGMVPNRLIALASEHAMVEWAKRTAVAEVAGIDLSGLMAYPHNLAEIRMALPLHRRRPAQLAAPAWRGVWGRSKLASDPSSRRRTDGR